MENNKIMIASPISNRFFAFLIDIFFVYLLRYIYISFSLIIWLKQPIIGFLRQYEILFGKLNFSKITKVEIDYFLNSELFGLLIIFVIGLFLIASIYNFILFSTKWSATIGQKLLGIYVTNKNGEKMKLYQNLSRSILIIVPWIFMFLIVLYQTLSNFYSVELLLNKTYIILSMIIFLSWYDLIFLTKNKIVFHDYITCTRVIIKHPENYQDDSESNPWKKIFPDFKMMYKDLKDIIKKQINKSKEIKAQYNEEKEKNQKEKKNK